MKSLSALENAHQLSQSPSHQTSHFSQSHNRSYLSISLASFRLSHESLSRSQRTPLNHSQLSQYFQQQAHEKGRKKEKEVLTKCHGGGGEGREEAGLQVIDFGILGFFRL